LEYIKLSTRNISKNIGKIFIKVLNVLFLLTIILNSTKFIVLKTYWMTVKHNRKINFY